MSFKTNWCLNPKQRVCCFVAKSIALISFLKNNKMQIRLTSPETFDRLIDYLEKERDLVWPEWSGFSKTYRDVFIETVKENMAKDTVLLNVEWEYNAQSNRVEPKVYYTIFSEIATDEEYLNEELKEKEKRKRYGTCK